MIYRAYVRVVEEDGAIFYEERIWSEDIRMYEVQERLPLDVFFRVYKAHDIRIHRGYAPLPLSYKTALTAAIDAGRDRTEEILHKALEKTEALCRSSGREYARTVYETQAMEGRAGILATTWEEFGGCNELAEANTGEYWWALNEKEQQGLERAVINGACSEWASLTAAGRD